MKKRFFPDLITWRLPLSYAGIALLVAVALGAVLIVTIRGYYDGRELAYLTGNARAIANVLQTANAEGTLDADNSTRDAHISSLSFLLQSHIKVTNAQGEVIADSGPPAPRAIALSREQIPVQEPVPPPSPESGQSQSSSGTGSGKIIKPAPSILYISAGIPMPTVPVGIVISSTLNQLSRTVNGATIVTETRVSDVLFTLPASGTPFGFGLGDDVEQDGRRSALSVSVPLLDRNARLIGTVELSEGPAYGGQVVDSIVRGWASASVIAVLLAVAVGLWISRRVSTPLVALTRVATRMAAGDLTARADVQRGDELGQLAHAYNDMAARVEETVQTLRRFIGDAAHELNTPLTALRTNLELSMDEEQAATRDDFASKALRQLERLQALSGSMLDLSRIESMTAVDAVRVNLSDLVCDASELYASRAEQAGVTFTLSVARPDITVTGDTAKLRRAVVNLLDNALKFTPPGGSITVALSDDGEWASLKVADTGIGIPVEDVPSLFSRFHRGHNAAAYAGSGLGLAIVKAIVDTHGGKVAYTPIGNSNDSGACFTLILPESREIPGV